MEKAAQEALAAAVITDDKLNRLHAKLEEADTQGVFFASFRMMMVAGRKI